MDLNFTEQQQDFQKEVRGFLDEHLDAEVSEKVKNGISITKSESEEWHNKLNNKGWLAGPWPKEFGGQDWGVVEKFIFEEECGASGAPRIVPFGVGMLAPVLMKFGSDEQRKHWLPRMLNGEDWWCQGYSEPGSGSDLASLKTTAVKENDYYIVNGQKTWTTLGQHADMVFCLVRTASDGQKQEGISFLLIDMKTPGVEVRPIILLDGEHEVNEVFFTNVRVPVENLVGEENKGWTYAKYLLTYERMNIAGVGKAMAAFDHLRQIARTQRKNGKPLAQDPLFAARMARVEIDLENMKTTNLRVLAASEGGPASLELGAMLKIRGTEIQQEITSLTRRALGPYAQPFVSEALDEGYNGDPVGPDYAAPVAVDYLNNRKLSIFGGSNEIQREIITKALLEL